MESSSINPYHYNNPVSFKDPTGLAPEPNEKEDEILSSKEDELQYKDMTTVMAEIIDDLGRYEIQREENFPKSSSLSFILIKYLKSNGKIQEGGYYVSSDELRMQVSLAWSGGGSSGGGGGNEAPPEPKEEDDETTTPREGSNDSEIGLTAKTEEEIIGSDENPNNTPNQYGDLASLGNGGGSNNDKEISSGDYDQLYYLSNINILPYEGAGVNSSFCISGGISYTKATNRLFISAEGRTEISRLDQVKFWGSVSLYIDNKFYQKRSFSMPSQPYQANPGFFGNIVFALPEKYDNVQLRIIGGYTFNVPEGSFETWRKYKPITIPIYRK